MIEVKNKSNERVTYNQVFFQRSNPGVTFNLADITSIDITNTFASKITNIDTLKDFIKSTYPISTQLEKVFAENNMKKTDLKMLQQYFYNFWINRNASDPEKSWMKYYVEVCKVNKFYSTSINKGYATDRGRVYLQYGEPNTITESVSDPSAPPYEIWLYYSLQNQRNRKFVFYLPDLVTNEYELIHSDALGEFNNPSWQMQIMKRNTTTNNPDQLKPDDYFGGKADDFFNHPH